MNSFTEENYLKAIYQLSRKASKGVSTTALAERLETKASSVTDMLKKLSAKSLIHYKKYQGVRLTGEGERAAVNIIRKHRLWEVFLVDKLKFKWDEVHDIAEELEHIRSEELVARLDRFLDHPTHDPHGDPIPDANGNIFHHKDFCLSDLSKSESGVIIGVKDSSRPFLQYLEEKGLVLGREIHVDEVTEFDGSMTLGVADASVTVSRQVSENLYIRKPVKA